MVFGSAPSARANTVEYLFTAGQLFGSGLTNFNGGTASCTTALINCGVLGIGLTGVTGSGSTVTSVSIKAPTLGSADAWTAFSGSELSTGNGVIAGSGMEEGGSEMAFITANTHIAGNTYCSDNSTPACGAGAMAPAPANSGGLSSAGVISTSDVLGFFVTYATTVSTSTAVGLNLELVVDSLNTTTGAQQGGAKTFGATGSLTATGTPEPSSIILVCGGVLGIAASRLRRRVRR